MIKLVIFDLDGVIVSTDELHYLAWNALATKENIPFNRTINHKLRGVSREQSLEIILQNAHKTYQVDEKQALLKMKNDIYVSSLATLSPLDILPGVMEVLKELRKRGIAIAIGSSSKNAKKILAIIGLDQMFDYIVDGNMITHSKPHPEVFLKACQGLQINPSETVVIEDARSGIDAAVNVGMIAIGINEASTYDKCHYSLKEIKELIPIIEQINAQKGEL